MAQITKGYVFGATETVTNTKLHNLVDLANITDIVDDDIAAGADIDPSKIDLASSGYTATGGNYTVTGAWNFDDIRYAKMRTLQVSSIASIAEARIGSLYANTSNLTQLLVPSLASISDVRLLNVYVGTANQGDIFYDNGTKLTRLPPGTSGQFLKTLGAGANPTWANTSGESVIFSFALCGQQADSQTGIVSGTDLTSGTMTYAQYGWCSYTSSYTTVIPTYWRKHSGVNTVKIYAHLMCPSSSDGYCQVSIGGQVGNVTIDSEDTWEWKSFTVDVSSLTNGTDYAVLIQLKGSGASAGKVILDSIIGLGY